MHEVPTVYIKRCYGHQTCSQLLQPTVAPGLLSPLRILKIPQTSSGTRRYLAYRSRDWRFGYVICGRVNFQDLSLSLSLSLSIYIYIYIYRVSQEECEILRESVP